MKGRILFTLGIIIALISAAKLPAPDAAWSDLLPLYLLGILLAGSGLWWWRQSTLSTEFGDSSLSNSKTDNPLLTLLPQLYHSSQALEQQLPKLDGPAIVKRVEELLNTFILPIVAGRQEVIYLLGRQQGVKVLLALAEGERLLNRMWSATNDGYLGEVYATCPKVVAAFEEAYQLSRK